MSGVPSGSGALRVAVIGARGRVGSLACRLMRADPAFVLAGEYGSEDDWRAAIMASGASVALDVTRAGLGREHGEALLERGIRPVIGTSGVDERDTDALDVLARARGLGGLVVPNFSLGACLLQRAACELAPHFDAIEIVERHHAGKADAPSATALDTARRMAAVRAREAFEASTDPARARGEIVGGIAVHSLRTPGSYAHQEVLLGRAGETLAIRHDMLGPEAFGPGILLALRHAAGANGVGRGLEVALAGVLALDRARAGASGE